MVDGTDPDQTTSSDMGLHSLLLKVCFFKYDKVNIVFVNVESVSWTDIFCFVREIIYYQVMCKA